MTRFKLKHAVLTVALLAGLSTGQAAAARTDAQTILTRADTIRNPQISFVVDVTLTAYENNVQVDSSQVTTHSRKDKNTGQFLSLVHIDEPARDAGKLLLRNGNILYFYDPASKASVRLSPRQRLLGNASNGDVITANLANDYTVALDGEEEVVDGDRRTRDAWRLHLVSRSEITPYHEITLWVDKADYRPLKGQFFSQSGRLLKVAWYRGWQPVMGETRPTEVIIADGFDPTKVTVMTMANHRPRDLPQSWFSKSWLPRFRPQR